MTKWASFGVSDYLSHEKQRAHSVANEARIGEVAHNLAMQEPRRTLNTAFVNEQIRAVIGGSEIERFARLVEVT
ncbi:hypothetical protein [Hyphomicrobium zavarzinii]|uniref:hypothetical protein n=1 Tax=Hyphomicrobium zavarzinii TaxID=48292 RepID=UPI00038284C0|nr:hypothetical protein [Hyphomicrobium zavarzinii]